MNSKMRGIAIAVLVAFFTGLMPTYAKAATDDKQDSITNSGKQDYQNNEKSKGIILEEIKSKREASIKYFIKDDGTYTAMMYNRPVHYYDGSEWKEIDNTLEEKTDDNGFIKSSEDLLKDQTFFKSNEGYDSELNSAESKDEVQENNKIFQNKENDFKVSIAQNLNSDKLVTIQKGKYELSWNIKSNKRVKVSKKELTKEEIDKIIVGADVKNNKNVPEAQKVEAENIEKSTVQKIASQVDFQEVKPNVDLQYKLISNNLKENIILKKPTDINNFSFNLNVKNLKPILKDNKITIADSETDKEILNIDAPFMVDSKGTVSSGVKFDLKKKGKGYVLTLNLDDKWLNDKERVYPVIVDPSITTSLQQQDIKETFVCSNDLMGKLMFIK